MTAYYEEATVKLTIAQLNKLESAAKNKTGKTLRITKENLIKNCLTNYL